MQDTRRYFCIILITILVYYAGAMSYHIMQPGEVASLSLPTALSNTHSNSLGNQVLERLAILEREVSALQGRTQQRQHQQQHRTSKQQKPHHFAHADVVMTKARRKQVVSTIKSAYRFYETHAFGFDEVNGAGEGVNWGKGSLMLQTIDALDTLYLAGLYEEFDRGVEKVLRDFRFDVSQDVSVFETTIRAVGGLLSAYAVSGNQHPGLLDKAVEITSALHGVYLPENFARIRNVSLPHAFWNPKTQRGSSRSFYSLADVGSVQLEYRALVELLETTNATVTNRNIAKSMVTLTDNVYTILNEFTLPNGLVSNHIERKMAYLSLGAEADSYYEYLLKTALFSDDTSLEKRYLHAMEGVTDLLIATIDGESSALKAGRRESISSTFHESFSMHHLACFAPGMLTLGARYLNISDTTKKLHLSTAKKVMTFCMQFYETATGLGVEKLSFAGIGVNEAGLGIAGRASVVIEDPRSSLRPETVESLFYLWRETKEQKWRDYGWEIYTAIETHAKMRKESPNSCYSEVHNANSVPVSHTGTMPTWFLAETMKYLYLLFSDDATLNLDCWVFNTEAHLFPKPCRAKSS